MGRRGASRARASALRVTLAAFAFLVPVGLWRSLGDTVPPAQRLPLTSSERLAWIRPGVGPAYLFGDAAEDDVLFVGDSRVGAAMVTSRFRRARIGDASVLWSGGVGLVDVLDGAADLACRRIVVAVSPLSLAPLENEVMQGLLSERVPPYDPTRTVGEVLRWSAGVRAAGVESGEWGPVHDASLGLLVRSHRDRRERERQWTHSFEHALRGHVEFPRIALLHPVYTRRWHASWLRPLDPRASDNRYRHFLSGPAVARRREAGRVASIEAARRLVESGREVAFVRLPIDAGLRAIEDASVEPGVLASIAEEVGGPYLDLGSRGGDPAWGTGDGSHLVVRDALRATDAVGAWLRDDVGW
ncbi:MAG: hypothetical protein AAF957_00330 [Planctomycetota bacterium]